VQKAPRSSRKAPAAKPPTLTVPVTPKLRTSSRSRTSVGALESESSRESLGGVSQQGSRSSLSGLRLTVPKSPKLSTSRRASRSAMGTDDARMREAEAAVEQLKKRRKLGEQRMRGALDRAVPAGNTLRSAKQLTLPQSPALSKSRRSVAPSRSVDDLTEAIRATLTTSQRPATARARSPPREHAAPKLTEPKTPTFSSFHKKARRVKSFKEIEDDMVEDAKRNQFKARPVSKRALESFGDVGVPKVAKRELTVPVAPRLHTSDRSVSRSRDSSLNESLSESSVESFRAKSVPRRRPSAPPASSEPRALTIPVSPNFRTSVRQGRRSSASSLTSLDDLPLPAFKAAPAPDMRKRFVPKHETRPLTEPKPFNLSSSRRSIDSLSSVEQPKERKLAAKGPRGLTETRPFRLAGEERHEYYKQTWAAQVDRELEEERARFSSFHARGMPAAITDAKKVFTPRRSGKPLTEVQNVQLASDRRSLSRQAFDAERAKREAAAEEARLEDARRAAEQERREVRALRRSMVPRARAVPDAVFAPAAEVPDVAQPSPTPPLSLSPPARPPSRMTGGHGAPTRGAAGRQVARSVKPLTEPMSPHFRTDARLRASVH
jgi:targeting protein for Xklp2